VGQGNSTASRSHYPTSTNRSATSTSHSSRPPPEPGPRLCSSACIRRNSSDVRYQHSSSSPAGPDPEPPIRCRHDLGFDKGRVTEGREEAERTESPGDMGRADPDSCPIGRYTSSRTPRWDDGDERREGGTMASGPDDIAQLGEYVVQCEWTTPTEGSWGTTDTGCTRWLGAVRRLNTVSAEWGAVGISVPSVLTGSGALRSANQPPTTQHASTSTALTRQSSTSFVFE